MSHCEEPELCAHSQHAAAQQSLQSMSRTVPEDLCQSPSLLASSSSGKSAFEIKFLLSETLAAELEWHFLDLLTIDPHAAAQPDQMYQVQTIYLDTPDLDVFHRRGNHKKQKLRIRRYGESDSLFLEQKSRRGRRVQKQRVNVTAPELAILGCDDRRPDWNGGWYHDEVLRWSLQPVCGMQYWRRTYFGASDSGAVRVTFDRRLQGSLHSGWTLPAQEQMVDVCPGQVICEMKFQETLPSIFKSAVEQFSLSVQGCSKYRRFMQQSQSYTVQGAECV